MPTEGLATMLAALGGSLVVGGFWRYIRLRLHVRTGMGRSLSVTVDVARAPSPVTSERSIDDAPRA